MISRKQYVPILKGKMGEFSALAQLDPEIKKDIVPLIDIVYPPKPDKKKNPIPTNKQVFDKYIITLLNYFKKYWDRNSPIYIDCYKLSDYLTFGIHPLKAIIGELHSLGFNVIPVISNVTDTQYNNTLKEMLAITNRGIALRILRVPNLDTASEIHRLLHFLNVPFSKIDLIIDLRSLSDYSVQEAVSNSIQIINSVPNLNKWRSFVLSGGNFPIDLTDITADQVYPLQRTEWKMWKFLLNNNQLSRIPAYSDYAISHPRIIETEISSMNASASIRYTHEEDFFIYRGRGTRKNGYEQFYSISETLINSDEYYQKEHCLGDAFIYECATQKNRKGNLTDWRRVGTNHHITVVVNQLRQFWCTFNAPLTS